LISNLLKKISETPGAPGFETQIRALVKKEIEGLVDEIQVDSMGIFDWYPQRERTEAHDGGGTHG
jgi:putative aminopeptidase FrvX